jgi:hypothetical protein
MENNTTLHFSKLIKIFDQCQSKEEYENRLFKLIKGDLSATIFPKVIFDPSKINNTWKKYQDIFIRYPDDYYDSDDENIIHDNVINESMTLVKNNIMMYKYISTKYPNWDNHM